MKISFLRIRKFIDDVRWPLVVDLTVVAACSLYLAYWVFDGLLTQGVYCDIGFLGRYALGVYGKLEMGGEEFIQWMGRSFPMALKPQHGPNEIYLTLPWIYAFGPSAIALHLSSMFWAVLTVPLLYFVAYRLYHHRLPAVVTSVLFVSSTSHIAAIRVGGYTGSMLLFWELSALAAFMQWTRSEKSRWFVVGSLCLGVGSGSRCFFWWFVTALLMVGLCTEYKRLRGPGINIRVLFVALAAFAAGMAPVIVSNIMHGFYTVKFFMSRVIYSQGLDHVVNLNYGINLSKRLGQLKAIIVGTAWNTETMPNGIALYLFVIGLVLVGGFLLLEIVRKKRADKALLFPVLLIVVVLAQSPFTPTNLDPHHLLILFPWVCLTIAAVLVVPFPTIMRRVLAGVWIILIVAAAWNGHGRFVRERAMDYIYGGWDVRWNTMGDVAEWCQKREIRKIGLGDTGLMDTFVYLTGGRVSTEEVFMAGYRDASLDEQSEDFLRYLRQNPSGYYLFRGKDQSPWVPFLNEFKRVALEEKYRVRRAAMFVNPDGLSAYEIYQTEPQRTRDTGTSPGGR
ncbi:MAG TPA: phospholipid carrier-dependent glycosyltransferase [Elusimicrobiota bacterium]|nr:phospholipid carrier-dependent glycosyltransferase [Elusimicrobiota bacterium]